MLTAFLNRLRSPGRRPTDRRDARTRPLLESMESRQLLTNLMIIDAASVIEGSGGGTTPMEFTVRLMAPAVGEVRVDYNTAGGTATSGVDFIPTQGTLIIPHGQRAGTITVPVVADDIIEPNEFFSMVLSRPVNATLVRASATGTIIDDDTPVTPELNIADQSITRGRSGWKLMTFTVSLNTSVSERVTVRATTENLTALAGRDYEHTSQLVTFEPGQQTATFTVKVFGSATNSTQVFGVRLADASVSIRKTVGFGSLRPGA